METILVIDDDPFFHESLHSMLDSHYVVISCIGGCEAVAMARKYLPEMILLDVMMDDVDGYTVCRSLKADAVTQGTPVIFITALHSSEDETYGLALGAVDFLTKPINPGIAHARIRNHLRLKRQEDELRQINLNMEHLVAQRTAELKDALAAAQAADRAKDAFLANISHELRTPLAAVIGFAKLARPHAGNLLLADYLEKIAIAGHTLSDIVDDLLDLSKIAAGRMEIDPRPFRLRQLVARSRSVISFKAEEKGLALHEDISPDLPEVLVGDTLRIEQILLNLLANAVKFTPAGQINLHLRCIERSAEQACIEIEVADTGIGLTSDEINRLFQPFSQTDASHSRNFGGTGLGLAICKRLAELMHGSISVSSTPGAGSSFRVRLHLGIGASIQLAKTDTARTPVQQIHYRNARVLVVDDQPFNRDIVAGLLAMVGIVPSMADNGQRAIDRLTSSSESFDLILMDVQMPVMDGLAATRLIRQMPAGSFLPIIAMTAHTMAHEREQSLVAGMNDHIGKPFEETDFYRVLARWIPASKQSVAEALPPPAPRIDDLQEIPGIDVQAGLALLQNDVARYRHWLAAFVTEAPATLAQLKQELANGNADAASMAAHTLKGRSGLLGMRTLHSLASQLEQAIEAGTATAPLLDALENGMVTICASLSRLTVLSQANR